jgi:hypothetical protein
MKSGKIRKECARMSPPRGGFHPDAYKNFSAAELLIKRSQDNGGLDLLLRPQGT